MSLASKFARAVLLLGLVAGLIVTWILAQREFSLLRASYIESTETLVRAQLTLPALVYDRDVDGLGRHLQQHLDSGFVRYAAVIDGNKNLLAARYRLGDDASNLPDNASLRRDLQPLETGIRKRSLEDSTSGWFGKVLPALVSQRVSDMSIPVVSPVNPLKQPVTSTALLNAWKQNTATASGYVLGYVNVGISHSGIWQQASAGLLWAILGCIAILTLATAIIWQYGRSLLSSMISLTEAARDAVSTDIDADLRFEARGEAKHIADLLNTAFAELKSYRALVNIDRSLLSLKVEAQGSMLTERNQQLDKARQQVSRTREDLHRMAYYDSLTGLPNRQFFTEQLNLMLRLCEREGKLLALMFLDLDNFKRINDSLGHSAGDLLLREVGIRLSKCLRASDLLGHFPESNVSVEVSRLGGDEFTLVLTNVKDAAEVSMVAERVLVEMAEPVMIGEHEIIITPSIGIALGPRDASEVEDLLKAADTAMYEAKAVGKNNYVFFTDEMKTSDVRRLQLETDLRRAIERNELELHYQPMVSIASGTAVGAEALLRWKHPEHGLIGPDKFIPMAEELGMIIEIGEWTLREACEAVVAMEREGYRLPKVSVNISPLAVSRTFVSRVKSIIKATGADPTRLELELTENVLMETGATPIQSLHELKALGVTLSIDDFGTGYSSLSYLSHFPLDTLKIDRSFVQDYNKSPNNEGLVEAIAAMAFGLDLNVVAEGVETSDQLKFLRGRKVDVIQGYLFSRPVTAKKLPFLLDKGHFKPKIAKALIPQPEGLHISPA